MDFIKQAKILRGMDVIEPLMTLIEDRGYIGGSYAAWMAGSCVAPNDIDIFATSQSNAVVIRDAINDSFEYGVYSANDVAMTFTAAGDARQGKIGAAQLPMDVQVVNPHPNWSKFPDDIIQSFDLMHSRAILIDCDTLLADDVQSLDGKILAIQNPVRTLNRVMKYKNRGIRFDEHELIKIFEAWVALAPERREEIKAQYKPIADDIDDSVFYDCWYEDDDYFAGEGGWR